MMTIDKFNFAGKKAIVRVDFNVPLDENGYLWTKMVRLPMTLVSVALCLP